ncbi:MAG: hypothetical protein D6715_12070 [Calditrichaeota bacterium]|nr:MAG: hypothetical protein D6715_12070 [Calditrichota bacterium]
MGTLLRTFNILLLFAALLLAAPPDSIPQVYYQIVSLDAEPERTVIKIKLPPQLSTAQLMEQVRLVVCWPGEEPPEKPLLIYVFPDTAPSDQPYQIGALYVPGKGFAWDLRDWRPVAWQPEDPSQENKELYNMVVERLLGQAMDFAGEESEAIKAVAREQHLSPQRVRQAYFRVKHWLVWQSLHRRKSAQQTGSPTSAQSATLDNSHLAP